MVESTPQTRNDEQYPLLKVADGGGDAVVQSQSSVVVSPTWNATSFTARRTWADRWPEFMSAIWMSLILFGVSFLIFYAIGMVAYRREPFVIVRCNTSNAAGNVYYHHIVSQSNSVPFLLFSDYLTNMALQYPHLRFNIYFLIDDSIQSALHSRHSRFYTKLLPYYQLKHEDYNKAEMRDFLKRFQNVNITIVPISKYMAMTPLRYKWRTIPVTFLPFYARLFSVWQNGGIAMDLMTFNNQFNNHQILDKRIIAILKQHNTGVNDEGYGGILNKIEEEEEREMFLMFYTLVSKLINETRNFFNTSISYGSNGDTIANDQQPLTHRTKREVLNDLIDNDNYENIHILNEPRENIIIQNSNYSTTSKTETNEKAGSVNKTTILKEDENRAIIGNSVSLHGDVSKLKQPINNSDSIPNKSEMPKLILFYDFSVISDGIGPSYRVPESINRKHEVGTRAHTFKPEDHVTPNKKSGSPQKSYLTIDSQGLFVAASSKLHPFLGLLISASCRRMHPKFAIQDALLSQCSGLLKDDNYCNSIYLI